MFLQNFFGLFSNHDSYLFYSATNRKLVEFVPSDDFKHKKAKLFEKLKSVDELDESLEDELISLYGSRGKRAIKLVKGGGVRREGDQWFVQGREKEYEVVGTYCSCFDFVLNIATDKAGVDMCYHALAKNIQELLDYG